MHLQMKTIVAVQIFDQKCMLLLGVELGITAWTGNIFEVSATIDELQCPIVFHARINCSRDLGKKAFNAFSSLILS